MIVAAVTRPPQLRSNEFMNDAACRAGVDPEIFFPTQGTSPTPARLVCNRCPVSSACLAYVAGLIVDGHVIDGIWAGRYATRIGKRQAAAILDASRGRNGRSTQGAHHDDRSMAADDSAP